MHYLDQLLEEGSTVTLQLDWNRRFDHMQQHSGMGVDLTYKVILEKPYDHLFWFYLSDGFSLKVARVPLTIVCMVL